MTNKPHGRGKPQTAAAATEAARERKQEQSKRKI